MLAIQVTSFECGGLVICVHASHVINDGISGSTFIHSWATACRLGIGEVVRPSFDLSLLFPSRDILGEIVNHPPPNLTDGVKVVTKIFVFDAAKIAELKDKLIGGSGEDRKPSRVEVVVTAVWKALILASRARNEEKLRNSAISVPVNLRGRTGLPTPENLMGNFYMLIATTFEPEQNTTEPNHIHLLGLLRESMRKSLATLAKLSNDGKISSAGLNFYNKVGKSMLDENVDVLNFTSWCRFPMYETDFGWGKPCWVSGARFPLEMVVLSDTNCGTGIEAWVGLKEPTLLEFEKDPDILGLKEPTKQFVQGQIREPPYFAIEVHHGGRFICRPMKVYNGGKTQIVHGLDPNVMSLLELDAMAQVLGYVDKVAFYYKLLGLNLDIGLVHITSDKVAFEMSNFLDSNMTVVMYLEEVRGVKVVDSQLGSSSLNVTTR
ncbi:hypothetical protein Vadar_032417 [Vaccinium darrowii]|uniref:Uncharacterized protein n=1 Tax=Vaccinium darrowii TaxID=229202 RepID=A0ACB7X5Y2_9ERIC|nr:hypothetical protein Vadar_032417 [Vaccinium darrowii]